MRSTTHNIQSIANQTRSAGAAVVCAGSGILAATSGCSRQIPRAVLDAAPENGKNVTLRKECDMRENVPTGSPWAATVGYSRAVRVGDHIWVSGTAAVGEDGEITAPGDPYGQAQRCLEIIVEALKQVGASPEHVVRTRMFVREPDHWQEVGRAHGEVFKDVKPATTMVFTKFIDPDMLVEIEAEAVLQ